MTPHPWRVPATSAPALAALGQVVERVKREQNDERAEAQKEKVG